MKYIIRIKAVSSCIGIRRSNLCYIRLEDKSYDLTKLPHPLKTFKGMSLNGMKLNVNGETKLLKPGYEEYYYKNNQVETLAGMETEQAVLGALLIPLDRKIDSFYNKAISDGERFDQWDGEFEYLLGLLYEYEFKDSSKAIEYYDKARAKGFSYNILD